MTAKIESLITRWRFAWALSLVVVLGVGYKIGGGGATSSNFANRSIAVNVAEREFESSPTVSGDTVNRGFSNKHDFEDQFGEPPENTILSALIEYSLKHGSPELTKLLFESWGKVDAEAALAFAAKLKQVNEFYTRGRMRSDCEGLSFPQCCVGLT